MITAATQAVQVEARVSKLAERSECRYVDSLLPCHKLSLSYVRSEVWASLKLCDKLYTDSCARGVGAVEVHDFSN
jgi:hypothetical protein